MKGARFIVVLLGAILGCFLADTLAQNTSQSLTLDETVELALQNSGDVALARARYAVSKNALSVGHAVFQPNLYAGSNAAYTMGFPFIWNQTPSVFNVHYVQTLFNLPLRGQDKAARERAEQTQIELQRVRDDVTVRAATTYLELADVQESLELAQGEESNAKNILSVVRERSGAGYELPIEVTRARLTLAKIEERLNKLRDRDDILRAQLRSLIGYASDKQLQVDSKELQLFEKPRLTFTIDPVALNSNPVIQEAERERDARSFIAQGEKGGYWPTVDAIGKYDVLSEINNWKEFIANPKSFRTNNVTVGISAHIPILNPTTSAKVALAKSQFQEAELSLAIQRQNVALDVKQRFQRLRELRAAWDVRELELKIADEVLVASQAREEQGRGIAGDVARARLEDNEKQEAVLDATFEMAREELLLLEMIGRLPDIFPSLTGAQRGSSR
jgi:outer membrane protein TolC